MSIQPRIVLLGPPGAGKGTQAAFISESLRIPHISTGDMMRAAIQAGGELKERLSSFVDAGRLVPDDLIIDVVRERLSQDDCRSGFLLDGFPRTLEQARALDELLAEIDVPLTHVIEFRVPTAVLVERLLKRAIDSGRSDDSEDVITERMKVYERQTLPVSDYYTGRLRVIDGEGSIEEIQARVRDSLREERHGGDADS